jgi:DNA-binding XRE family transcriptional regulator
MTKKLTEANAPLLLRARLSLGMTQGQFGRLVGAERKTVARRERGATPALHPSEVRALVGALFPVDPELAAEVAEGGGETLESLGHVAPPPPPVAPALAHLVDAVVMAAVEANGRLTPRLRPTLSAAFHRALAMGLTVEQVARGLGPPAGAAVSNETKTRG